MGFNPNDHKIKVQGNREYLPAAARVIWFRRERPDHGISTEALVINLTPDGNRPPYAIFKATITDATGRVVATGHKMEDIKGFPDFLEKAETGSIGRALSTLGYGTAAAADFDEGEKMHEDGMRRPAVVDTPQTAAEEDTQDPIARFLAVAQEHGFALCGPTKVTDPAKVQQLLSDVYRYAGKPKPARMNVADYVYATSRLGDYARDIDEAKAEPTPGDTSPTEVSPSGDALFDGGEFQATPDRPRNYTDAETTNRGKVQPNSRANAGAA